jgi:hypothetical protein
MFIFVSLGFQSGPAHGAWHFMCRLLLAFMELVAVSWHPVHIKKEPPEGWFLTRRDRATGDYFRGLHENSEAMMTCGLFFVRLLSEDCGLSGSPAVFSIGCGSALAPKRSFLKHHDKIRILFSISTSWS